MGFSWSSAPLPVLAPAVPSLGSSALSDQPSTLAWAGPRASSRDQTDPGPETSGVSDVREAPWLVPAQRGDSQLSPPTPLFCPFSASPWLHPGRPSLPLGLEAWRYGGHCALRDFGPMTVSRVTLSCVTVLSLCLCPTRAPGLAQEGRGDRGCEGQGMALSQVGRSLSEPSRRS